MYNHEKDLQFYCLLQKLCTNVPIKHFARDIGAVKWHPYNVDAQVISFVKEFSREFSVFYVMNKNIKKRGARDAIIFFLQF